MYSFVERLPRHLDQLFHLAVPHGDVDTFKGARTLAVKAETVEAPHVATI